MFNLSRSKEFVGLDIGSYSIKAVELKAKKKGKEELYELEKYGYEALPYDAIVEGNIVDTGTVSEIIRLVFNENKIDNKNVVISISGNAVIIKKITLPAMESDELAESIIWEAKHNIPYAYDEINVDYAILTPPKEMDVKDLDILLVAAKKDKIENYKSVVLQARKNIAAIEVDAFALQNSLELNYPEVFREKTTAMINIGAHITNIIVIEKGSPQLFRDISLGGFFFTDHISKELNISIDEAEKLLKGIPLENIKPEQTEVVLGMNTKELLEEIEKTFSFYEVGEKKEKKIDHIFLSGGLAKLKDLDKQFEEKLKIKTEIFDPFRRVTVNEKKFDIHHIKEMSPIFGVSIGLATRKAEKKS